MNELGAFSATAFWAFIQVLARVSALFVSAPFFGDKAVPTQTKIGLAVLISYVLVPVVKPSLGNPVPTSIYATFLAIAGQVVIGLVIGFMVGLVFSAVQIGGSMLDYQMGFSQAATFNPQFNEQIAPVSDFQYRYALVIYLLANGHWMLLATLQRSFLVLPVSKLVIGPSAVGAFIDVTFQTILLGLEIAAPVSAVLLITDVSFAFLNRAVPQMQVYFVGMPVKVMVGFSLLLVVLPLFTAVVAHVVTSTPGYAFTTLHGMHQ